jgi:hypothetical protein
MQTALIAEKKRFAKNKSIVTTISFIMWILRLSFALITIALIIK